MSETIYDAFREASATLGTRSDAFAWIQFQFELDKEFPEFEKDLKGGFGRRLALFMFSPENYEAKRDAVIRAARRANEVAERIRKGQA